MLLKIYRQRKKRIHRFPRYCSQLIQIYFCCTHQRSQSFRNPRRTLSLLTSPPQHNKCCPPTKKEKYSVAHPIEGEKKLQKRRPALLLRRGLCTASIFLQTKQHPMGDVVNITPVNCCTSLCSLPGTSFVQYVLLLYQLLHGTSHQLCEVYHGYTPACQIQNAPCLSLAYPSNHQGWAVQRRVTVQPFEIALCVTDAPDLICLFRLRISPALLPQQLYSRWSQLLLVHESNQRRRDSPSSTTTATENLARML